MLILNCECSIMLEVELLRRKHWNRKVEMVQRTLLVESFIL